MDSIKPPYKRFAEMQDQLSDVEAIDYFFAKQFYQLLLGKTASTEQLFQPSVLFHLLVALSVSLREGHACLPIASIGNQRFGFACDDNQVITHQGYTFPTHETLELLLIDLKIGVDCDEAIVFTNGNIYMRRYYQFEKQVLAFVSDKEKSSKNISLVEVEIEKIEQCLKLLFANTGKSDDCIDWQLVAVANALNKQFSIIAGGPGTGKTYTVTKLLIALVMLNEQNELKISLVAPTGKAAQRLSESIVNAVTGFKGLVNDAVLSLIPTQAQTIHRLLGVIPNSPNFKHNQSNLLDSDILLIDEVSMVDLPLMARVFSALPSNCKVILLGDADQLPSVAAGSILADLTPNRDAKFSASNINYLKQVTHINNLPTSKLKALDHLTYLTQSRRFNDEGGIGLLAKCVISGDSEGSWCLLQQAKESKVPQLNWTDSSGTSWLEELVEQYYRPLQHAQSIEQAFQLLGKFRVLSATRVGDTGVEALNHHIEDILLNSTGKYFGSGSSALYHAKPIMISENDYGLGLYNGDIGIIWKSNEGILQAVFQQELNKKLFVLPSRLPTFETVYAMTIHKTQGSEFEHVAMILPNNVNNQLLSRELLYTGITRAKEQLTIQCKKNVWNQGVDSKVSRHSGIKLI